MVPAREGTLRVLRAARAARGVRRVVLTSAFHAVGWGHPHDGHVFTEADWTILDGSGVDAYAKSKTLAERAAWDFIAAESGGLELTTMLPVAVMGPVMGKDVSRLQPHRPAHARRRDASRPQPLYTRGRCP
ncbi:NAD-dependent epimerase/dehydratase family protein [Caulobacter sp. UC70_42]|uniref:NAD-dependent epimerase/dehydratase family protein n=1 Tax=Caulobacter sp. UC70_42 TaxID=3374551 RepID=UPI003756F3C2